MLGIIYNTIAFSLQKIPQLVADSQVTSLFGINTCIAYLAKKVIGIPTIVVCFIVWVYLYRLAKILDCPVVFPFIGISTPTSAVYVS